MSNSLDSNQDQGSVNPELGPTWLQRLSADGTSRQMLINETDVLKLYAYMKALCRNLIILLSLLVKRYIYTVSKVKHH